LARTAALDFGATVANYVRGVAVQRDADGKVVALDVRDETTGEIFSVTTRSLVNATGVWADDIFSMAEGSLSKRITPAKGVHITVPHHRLPADVASVFAVPGDRRSVFVVPFEEAAFTFVGTTDTAYDGSLDDPWATADDVDYLISAINASTSSQITREDVTGIWAGLRPLLAPEEGESLKERTADLSRRHKVISRGDGVVHITGGKWTTYRQMAEDTVDVAARSLGNSRRCDTKSLALRGASNFDTVNAPDHSQESIRIRGSRSHGDDRRTA
jgi:glycerol-3-phosphate dehydrogenase